MCKRERERERERVDRVKERVYVQSERSTSSTHKLATLSLLSPLSHDVPSNFLTASPQPNFGVMYLFGAFWHWKWIGLLCACGVGGGWTGGCRCRLNVLACLMLLFLYIGT